MNELPETCRPDAGQIAPVIDLAPQSHPARPASSGSLRRYESFANKGSAPLVSSVDVDFNAPACNAALISGLATPVSGYPAGRNAVSD